MGDAGLLVGCEEREESEVRAMRPRLQLRHGDIVAWWGAGRHTTEPADFGRTACPAQGSLALLLGALGGWLRKDRRPPGCGASTWLPTSPACCQGSENVYSSSSLRSGKPFRRLSARCAEALMTRGAHDMTSSGVSVLPVS